MRRIVRLRNDGGFLLNLKFFRHHPKNVQYVAISGGCAYNSVANGKIKRRTEFKYSYLQSAPEDAGGAIGAALYVWHRLSLGAARFRMARSRI